MKKTELSQKGESFSARLRQANLQEYWEVDYRVPEPRSAASPYIWRWAEYLPLLIESGDVIGIEESERRALILANPTLGGQPYTTSTLFADLQLLRPGESASAHRHTTSASRFFLQGSGAYTTVEGEKCPMGPGDLITNPSWAWHDHGNEGNEDVIYLNVLDVPLVANLDCVFYDYNYAEERDLDKHVQSAKKPLNYSHDLYSTGGVLPKFVPRSGKSYSPQLVYRWENVAKILQRLKSYQGDPYDGVIVEYVNPETGGSVMPTMSFRMQLLRPGERTLPHRHTSSTVYCVVEGQGYTQVNGERLEWVKHDIFVLPSWVWHEHVNVSATVDAVIFSVTDAPAIQKLGVYREQSRTRDGEVIRIERD